MDLHFKLQVMKHLPYKIAEKNFNSNIQMNRKNHVGMRTVYMCMCVCVCVCVFCVSQCVLLHKFSN